MPDPLFEDPRLASLYDLLEGDRPDLVPYVEMVAEFGARSVLDIGCGTGTFACRLAERGSQVTGLDPAPGSLDVARSKLGADMVEWVLGDVSALPDLQVDVVAMTGNVAQVFLLDEEWDAVLRAARASLKPEGHLVFECRNPVREAWRGWNRDETYRRVVLPDGGAVETWVQLTKVDLPLVMFRHSFWFSESGELLTSDSTLRFRGRDEIAVSLTEAGFTVAEVRDAPDRPDLELVFISLHRTCADDDGRPSESPRSSSG
jgi:ubiquinone/menaquinone biosynthesis C-methylase UbiE